MIISQFIRDITNDTRYTINFYCIVRRPKNKPARLYVNVLWKDDRDLEKPKLRKRKLSGYLVYPNGKYRRFIPQYFEMHKPDKEIIDIFEEKDRQAKSNIIKNKIGKLIKEMQADLGQETNKVAAMVDWYITNSENIHLIGKKYKDKWRVSPKFREMHELTTEEAKLFEKNLNERLKAAGAIVDEETQLGLNDDL